MAFKSGGLSAAPLPLPSRAVWAAPTLGQLRCTGFESFVRGLCMAPQCSYLQQSRSKKGRSAHEVCVRSSSGSEVVRVASGILQHARKEAAAMVKLLVFAIWLRAPYTLATIYHDGVI